MSAASQHISVLPLKVSMLSFKNFCYLVRCGETGEAVLVDPAWEIDTIETELQQSNSRLAAILLTHSHIDHVHLASPLAQRHGVDVFMAKTEIDHYGFSCKNLQPIASEERMKVGGIDIQVHMTPGHTKGSLCFSVDNSLFTGDTLFTEGCGICMGRGADPVAMFHSLQRLKKTISLETRIFPGHTYGTPPGQSFRYLLKNNLYLCLDDCQKFVDFRMRDNQSTIFQFQ